MTPGRSLPGNGDRAARARRWRARRGRRGCATAGLASGPRRSTRDQVVVVVVADRGGAGQHPDLGEGGEPAAARRPPSRAAGRAVERTRLPSRSPPSLGLLVDQHRPARPFPGGERGGEPGRAAADHEHVAVQVAPCRGGRSSAGVGSSLPLPRRLRPRARRAAPRWSRRASARRRSRTSAFGSSSPEVKTPRGRPRSTLRADDAHAVGEQRRGERVARCARRERRGRRSGTAAARAERSITTARHGRAGHRRRLRRSGLGAAGSGAVARDLVGDRVPPTVNQVRQPARVEPALAEPALGVVAHEQVLGPLARR